jgi:NAD-dependent SIR2 family protein deacetylase
MESHQGYTGQVVRAFATVRCLDCGSTYTKPMGRGTAAANPGCPECGYLGWLPFSAAPSQQSRFDADPLPRRFA